MPPKVSLNSPPHFGPSLADAMQARTPLGLVGATLRAVLIRAADVAVGHRDVLGYGAELVHGVGAVGRKGFGCHRRGVQLLQHEIPDTVAFEPRHEIVQVVAEFVEHQRARGISEFAEPPQSPSKVDVFSGGEFEAFVEASHEVERLPKHECVCRH